jgi:arylsulfatase A-like enzyme
LEIQPNIILIISDDQGYADLSCAGLAKDVSTPNLDRLADRGVRFTQAYATSPICSPSRAGIETGCYQQRWGTFWYGGKGIHNSEYKTIAELLKKNDYATGYIGKVHYGSHDADTANRSFPLNHGFDYFLGHTSARKHYLHHEQKLEDDFQAVKKEHNKWGQSLRQQALWDNFDKLDTMAFTTELFGVKACEFIDKHKEDKFFLQLSFNAVHNFTHQLPPEYLKEKELKGYHDWDPASEDYYDWYKAGRYPNNPEGRAQYLWQLYFLDMEIGRVLDHLKELGLDENTIVFYISDNGGSTPIYANNYPLRGSKYLLYEGGIRVPMIVSWPYKYSEGTTLSNVVCGMDIFPTICAAVGIEIPANIDGIDLNPLLSGNDKDLQHDTLFWDTGHETAVRVGKWKYRMANDDSNAKYEMVEIELGEFLYDLEKDPGEITNLADQFPDVFHNLKSAHDRWRKNIGGNKK